MAEIERKKFLSDFHIETEFGENFELWKKRKIKIFENFNLTFDECV